MTITPFGGEIPVGVDNRPSCYGTNTYPAAPDLISEKFTSKERDGETGLDYFGARYMSAAQGRFHWPRPSAGMAEGPSKLEHVRLWSEQPPFATLIQTAKHTGSVTPMEKTNCGDISDSQFRAIPKR